MKATLIKPALAVGDVVTLRAFPSEGTWTITRLDHPRPYDGMPRYSAVAADGATLERVAEYDLIKQP